MSTFPEILEVEAQISSLTSAHGQIEGEPTNRKIETKVSQVFKLADYMNCPAWLMGRAGSLDVTLLAVFLPPFPPVHTS